jgi:hypothetical protein
MCATATGTESGARSFSPTRRPARVARPIRSARPAARRVNARTTYGELEKLQKGELKESFVLQHVREVAVDHGAGLFAGTNDLVERIGGRPAMTLEEFIEKHMSAFG